MSGTKWLQKQEHFEWMQKCLACWQMCEEFMVWSIENGKNISSINACRDATEMCSQCIKFEAQRSPFFKQLCEVCAEICEKFADELGKSDTSTDLISHTIDACKTFAEACRQVSKKEERDSLPPNNEFARKRQNGF